MIQKVSLYFILPMCIIAFFLALAGVERIEFGNDYYTFISSVGRSFDNWKLQIPDIPKVPTINNQSSSTKGTIIAVLVAFVNFLVKFVNVIVSILNIVINVINIAIQIIQFILTLIYQCKDFITRLSSLRVAYV